jgi:coenzyme PQQ biosynthesis protein PqqD
MPPLDNQRRPALGPGARLSTDPLSGQPLLLYPEGVLELEETTAAILQLCVAPSTVGKIVVALKERYEAPEEEIARDVAECLTALSERGLIVFKEG